TGAGISRRSPPGKRRSNARRRSTTARFDSRVLAALQNPVVLGLDGPQVAERGTEGDLCICGHGHRSVRRGLLPPILAESDLGGFALGRERRPLSSGLPG